jgi:hypothetical protein
MDAPFSDRNARMRKRIRLHQVRVGMYIEELEGTMASPSKLSGPVVSPADIDLLINSHAISVVIDTHKGLDVDAALGEGNTPGLTEFETALRTRFTAEHLSLARKAIEETKPC